MFSPSRCTCASSYCREKANGKVEFQCWTLLRYNLKEEAGNTSQLAGLNFAVDVPITSWFSAGVEQAGFYHFNTSNNGVGGRSIASPDFTFGDKTFRSHIGGNIGNLYRAGINNDILGGPEIGFTAGQFMAKLAYDIPLNRDGDKGIINTTLDFSF